MRPLRLLAWNLAGAVAGLVFFTNATFASPPASLARALSVALVFSLCISGLCFSLLPRLGPFLAVRATPRAYWATMIAAMVVLAGVGSLLAVTLLSAAGVVQLHEVLRELRASFRVSLAITLAIGITVTVLETMKGRLERVQIALRTKERDEADARRAASEARLAVLESRVQPHFLFNTLNSIAALIPQDPAGAERMTGQLASLMRASLDRMATPQVPLRQELRSVRDYLDIEQVRFGERLRYRIDLPDGVEHTRVPRLALQTLVENSVKFAVSPRREGGEIRVGATVTASRLALFVEDDGPGFDPAATPEDHGLALLRDRLRLTYGDAASLDVRRDDRHTRVVVTVPR